MNIYLQRLFDVFQKRSVIGSVRRVIGSVRRVVLCVFSHNKGASQLKFSLEADGVFDLHVEVVQHDLVVDHLDRYVSNALAEELDLFLVVDKMAVCACAASSKQVVSEKRPAAVAFDVVKRSRRWRVCCSNWN
jgi:hypothetical protein